MTISTPIRSTGRVRIPVLDLALGGFVLFLLALGLRRPFIWVLAYLYVDILAPQKISWFLLAKVPLSLIVFVAAFGGWLSQHYGPPAVFGLCLVLTALWLAVSASMTSPPAYNHGNYSMGET